HWGALMTLWPELSWVTIPAGALLRMLLSLPATAPSGAVILIELLRPGMSLSSNQIFFVLFSKLISAQLELSWVLPLYFCTRPCQSSGIATCIDWRAPIVKVASGPLKLGCSPGARLRKNATCIGWSVLLRKSSEFGPPPSTA